MAALAPQTPAQIVLVVMVDQAVEVEFLALHLEIILAARLLLRVKDMQAVQEPSGAAVLVNTQVVAVVAQAALAVTHWRVLVTVALDWQVALQAQAHIMLVAVVAQTIT